MYKVTLKGLDETKEFGIKLGKILKSKDMVSLTGDLGAGKTTLTKSIGLGLGVEDYITSPTFALVNEYEGRDNWVYHFDVYRLENIEDLDDLGFDEYFYSDGINIIEWGNKIEKLLPKDRINLEINKGEDLDERIITISGEGERVKKVIEELEK